VLPTSLPATPTPQGSIPSVTTLSAISQESSSAGRPDGKKWWVDIVVGCGVLALIVALVVPTLNSRALALPTATEHLVGALRLARAGAINRGLHVRVTVQRDAYAVEQLQDHDGDGMWTPDTTVPAWRVPLPPSVSVEQGAGTVIQFDPRGGAATPTSNLTETGVTIRLRDANKDQPRAVQILPSGQIRKV